MSTVDKVLLNNRLKECWETFITITLLL